MGIASIWTGLGLRTSGPDHRAPCRIMNEELREERLRARNDEHRRFGFDEDELFQKEAKRERDIEGWGMRKYPKMTM